jgi:hypothetical protein
VISVRKVIAVVAVAAGAVATKVGLDKLRASDLDRSDVVAGLRRRGRHTIGRAKGLTYHALRRHPSKNVDDATLADRVRSTIGPVEKQLRMPRVHVMAEKGVVILHGEVPSQDAADQVVRAVEHVAGVRGVRSHLAT